MPVPTLVPVAGMGRQAPGPVDQGALDRRELRLRDDFVAPVLIQPRDRAHLEFCYSVDSLTADTQALSFRSQIEHYISDLQPTADVPPVFVDRTTSQPHLIPVPDLLSRPTPHRWRQPITPATGRRHRRVSVISKVQPKPAAAAAFRDGVQRQGIFGNRRQHRHRRVQPDRRGRSRHRHSPAATRVHRRHRPRSRRCCRRLARHARPVLPRPRRVHGRQQRLFHQRRRAAVGPAWRRPGRDAPVACQATRCGG